VRRMLTAGMALPDGTKIAVARLVFRSADLPLRPTSCDHLYSRGVQSPFPTIGYFGRPKGANRACFLTVAVLASAGHASAAGSASTERRDSSAALASLP